MPSGMHLCAGCAPPIFYPNFVPNADEGDFAQSPIVPDWVREMRQFSPRRIAAEEIGVIKKNLISFSMGCDLRMTVQSGMRLPPYPKKEKGSVNVAWDELAKVLFQFSYVSILAISLWLARMSSSFLWVGYNGVT